MHPIPLHTFRYHRTHPLPFEIRGLDALPPAALASAPNRHTFYELFWITSGLGAHVIDFVAYPIRPHTLYFIAPGQIHLWQIAEALHGYVILLAPEFFHASSRLLLDELALFHPGECAPSLTLTDADALPVEPLLRALVAEYATPQFGQLAALQALVEVLLIRIQRIILTTSPASDLDAPTQLSRRFLRLVDARYVELHTVAAYAAQLGVTAGHLGDTVRRALGRSAVSVIRERRILEAKRLLAHSDTPASAIAQALQFADPSYFGRMFQQLTGQSPLAFRTEFRKMYQSPRDSSLA